METLFLIIAVIGTAMVLLVPHWLPARWQTACIIVGGVLALGSMLVIGLTSPSDVKCPMCGTRVPESQITKHAPWIRSASDQARDQSARDQAVQP